MINELLRRLKTKTLYGSDGPYLTRTRLLSLGDRIARVYLHYFHRSDEDVEMHSHPWKWAVAVVLKGGYVEYRAGLCKGSPVVRHVRLPGSIVLLKDHTFHRVELLDEDAGSWSLFIAGPKATQWFFMHPTTKRLVHWREFILSKGLVPFDA